MARECAGRAGSPSKGRINSCAWTGLSSTVMRSTSRNSRAKTGVILKRRRPPWRDSATTRAKSAMTRGGRDGGPERHKKKNGNPQAIDERAGAHGEDKELLRGSLRLHTRAGHERGRAVHTVQKARLRRRMPGQHRHTVVHKAHSRRQVHRGREET